MTVAMAIDIFSIQRRPKINICFILSRLHMAFALYIALAMAIVLPCKEDKN